MQNSHSSQILRVDASARYEDSHSRSLVKHFIDSLRQESQVDVRRHDVGAGVPLIDQTWVRADNAGAGDRNEAHRQALAYSDRHISDLHRADLLVVGTPIYNFGLPASLKAWLDQVARAGQTFEYTEDGPRGLVEETRAVVVVASGGVEVGSDVDYATDHLLHVLGFMGIDDVEIVAADQLLFDDESQQRARAELDEIADNTVSTPRSVAPNKRAC